MNYTMALSRFVDAVFCKACSKPMSFEQLVDFDEMPQQEGESFIAARAVCCGLVHNVKGTFLSEV